MNPPLWFVAYVAGGVIFALSNVHGAHAAAFESTRKRTDVAQAREVAWLIVLIVLPVIAVIWPFVLLLQHINQRMDKKS